MDDKKEDEILLTSARVKRIIKDSIDSPNTRISGSGLKFMTEVATEFIEFMALAALDESERPKQYVDSTGVMKALVKMGLGEIADEIPSLDGFSEDMLEE
ncbi:hypothetical protein TRFO_02873 [Tritrichomonas foetus]|uniref:Transcription factor CBF/NF-Y/archaeal histone domain-containing protein n=1 Tax=Tritrichomonas foetus TaxID=1144522 RepID=A0A1J4L0R3_9EUKA|nr:hypothetical protein TRFO_02873 [Tritrichomonas foetus]|eukprot:OHT15540.1 hypothetical protein TRFO_02873 [Tritrichomonas foetus]